MGTVSKKFYHAVGKKERWEALSRLNKNLWIITTDTS